jgi:hypothetical protein
MGLSGDGGVQATATFVTGFEERANCWHQQRYLRSVMAVDE